MNVNQVVVAAAVRAAVAAGPAAEAHPELHRANRPEDRLDSRAVERCSTEEDTDNPGAQRLDPSDKVAVVEVPAAQRVPHIREEPSPEKLVLRRESPAAARERAASSVPGPVVVKRTEPPHSNQVA